MKKLYDDMLSGEAKVEQQQQVCVIAECQSLYRLCSSFMCCRVLCPRLAMPVTLHNLLTVDYVSIIKRRKSNWIGRVVSNTAEALV